MAIPIPIEWRRLHLAGARAMLRVERLALADMRGSVDRVLRAYASTARGPRAREALPAAARELRAALAADLLRARGASRRASHAALDTEFDLALEQGARRGLEDPGIRPELVGPTLADQQRVDRAVLGYVDAWQVVALEQFDKSKSVIAPWRKAANENASRIESQATTEVAEAWSAEREESTAAFVQRPESRAWAPLLVKIWDATLDRRRCHICRDMSGTIRPWGISFPGGRVPGGAHPRCRCSEVTMLLPLTWKGEDRVELDEAA